MLHHFYGLRYIESILINKLSDKELLFMLNIYAEKCLHNKLSDKKQIFFFYFKYICREKL